MVTSEKALELLRGQLADWETAGDNYRALSRVRVKEFDFDTCRVNVQFNPARIASSSAKVDAKSLKERKCFLCPANLPAVQKGLPFGNDYQVLVNPFPIFPEHFTIPVLGHEDQRILPRFGDMLDLAKALDRFTIFYNGPKCGASAPDHAHFQAGNKGFLLIEKEWKAVEQELIYMKPKLSLYVLRNYLRNVLVIESEDKDEAARAFEKIYGLLEIKPGEEEPMLNLLTWYEDGWWVTCVFPREKHRPDCYSAEGDANILLSPASVDMGGVFITPQEKDFEKITANDIRSILKEVCIDDAKMDKLIARLNEEL